MVRHRIGFLVRHPGLEPRALDLEEEEEEEVSSVSQANVSNAQLRDPSGQDRAHQRGRSRGATRAADSLERQRHRPWHRRRGGGAGPRADVRSTPTPRWQNVSPRHAPHAHALAHAAPQIHRHLITPTFGRAQWPSSYQSRPPIPSISRRLGRSPMPRSRRAALADVHTAWDRYQAMRQSQTVLRSAH